MHPEIEKLRELQRLDARLEILLTEFQRRPQALAAQDDEIGELEGRRAEIVKMRTDKQVEIDRAQLEAKSFEEKISDNQERLGKAANDTEFQGFQKQIERYEGEKTSVEESIMVLMDEMDMIKKAERELSESLGQAEGDASADADEFEKELAEIRAEATTLVEKRDKTRTDIDAELLDKYDLLFSRYRVTSLSSAEGGVCAGCHMALSPQIMNQLKTGREVIICNHCSRLLHL
ncbi:MAG: C4-type zinc ribbon domain-containing protein [Planctomycetota bacterium]